VSVGRRATRLMALPVVAAILALACAQAGAVTPRTTLPVIERQVMCATCKIPLNVAESPQADRERVFIRRLIAQGETEAQIKSALVVQYGQAVLGLPSPKGFDLAAYLVPVAVVLALLALLALLLPSWRRHARAHPEGHTLEGIPWRAYPGGHTLEGTGRQAGRQTGQRADMPELSASDAARLDADLKRFD
jgi:cytochrome c-type biogenesis protein CcmH